MDECYTTVDRTLKYTLVHLKKKNRDTALHKFLTYCSQKYGIVEQEIFCGSNVSVNSVSSGLFEHPAVRMLIEHKMESHPCFSWWIETPGLRGGGILETYTRRVTPSPAKNIEIDWNKDEKLASQSIKGGSVSQVA